MPKSSAELSPEEYNEEVFFCQNCHSLAVIVDEVLADKDWDGTFCGKCFSTNIGRCKFGEWLEEEERREAKKREIEWSKL